MSSPAFSALNHPGIAPVPAGAAPAGTEAWLTLKQAATDLQPLQNKNGSVDAPHHDRAAELIGTICAAVTALAPVFPHDAEYLRLVVADFDRWVAAGLETEPDFLDSLMAFQPQRERVDGLSHLVVFPMYTQNGSSNRLVEAVLIEVIWPDFVAELEAGEYSNGLFVPIRFLDFTPGYDTNSAVLFPETVAVRETPAFTWGAIFADREAARFRRVLGAAADITSPPLRTSPRCSCPPKQPNSSRTSCSRRKPSSCGTSSTTAPTCAETCRLTRL